MAESTHIRVIDMSDKFIGHCVCDDDEWANAATLTKFNSFHPNAAGHQQYAREIATALGLTVPNF